jgi:hypothetical protein
MVLLNLKGPVLQYEGGAHESEMTGEMTAETTAEMNGKTETIVDRDMMLTTPKLIQQRPQIPAINLVSFLEIHLRTQSHLRILYRSMTAMLRDKRDPTSPKDPITRIQILSINSACQTQNQIRVSRGPNGKSKVTIIKQSTGRVARMKEDTAQAGRTCTIPGIKTPCGLMQ